MRLRDCILTCAVGWALAAPAAAAPGVDVLSSPWKGEWTSPKGFLYYAESHLNVGEGGAVEGHFQWTLKRSPRPSEQKKLDFTGKEFVRGRFDAVSGILTLEGYQKEDPHGILGLDKYRLLLAENGQVLTGMTWNNGSWRGIFSLTR
ncbi:MAG: hypothetical protein HY553_19345 [Elusimicrobia bacterium]|nr:hypothetical protein [Elusimicrobiota bacterium]